MLYLFCIFAGAAFGLAGGGSLGNLAQLKFRWPWLILAAVVIRIAVLAPPLNHIEAGRYVYVAALVAIVAWTLWHVNRLPGIWLVSAGAALNLIVIAANGFRMPVAPEFAGALVRQGNIGQYTLMGSTTNLNAIADWIKLYPSSEVYSPGDVLVSLGLAIVVFLSVRNRTKELSPP